MLGILDTILAFSFLGAQPRILAKRNALRSKPKAAKKSVASVLRAARRIDGRLSLSAQWARLSTIIETASDSAALALTCHRAATEHLEAAAFHFDLMLEELSGILEITPNSAVAVPVAADAAWAPDAA